MTRRTIIYSRLSEAFHPSSLEVIDESAQHAGHAAMKGISGGESHFRVRIVSDVFSGMSRVQMHRSVNDCLKDLFDDGLHALAIEARVE